jgi:hypothetical protein
VRYEWQGIAYLLLLKSEYNLVSAVEDAIVENKFQLVHSLLMKFQQKNHNLQLKGLNSH